MRGKKGQIAHVSNVNPKERMMISQPKLTEQNRQKARDLVLYELNRFRFAVKILLDKQRFSDCRETVRKKMGSAIRDSAYLHARNLLYFFAKSPKFEKDIVASDFLPANEDGSLWRSSHLSKTESWLNHMNKLRNHLTYERIDNQHKWQDTFHTRIISEEIESAWEEFLSLLPKSERKLWQQDHP